MLSKFANNYNKLAHVLLFLSVIICEISSSGVLRPRGVSLSRASLYPPDKDFVCFDGSLTIPFSQVNDDYCDCPDASDEPGTAACPHGTFHCTNAGHRPMNIASSRVNDGICDCCDASDEYANPNSKCINNCNELGRSARVEAQRKAELLKIGSQLRAELGKQGVVMKQQKKEKLVELQKSRAEAEQVQKEKQAIKAEIEELENAALEQYRKIEENEKRIKQEEENAKVRQEATEAFQRYDSNQDGKIDSTELQARQTFDQDRNGEVSEAEAKFFLNDQPYVELQDWLTVSWDKVKPFVMMEQGLFKPPSTPAPELEDDEQEEDHEETEHDEHEPEHEDEEGYKEEEDGYEGEAEEIEENPEKDDPTERTKPVYDEDTQKLIDRATAIRAEYSEAERTVRDLQNQISNIEESLQKDYGLDEEFAPLDGQCFEYTDREYIYKLCPFDKTTQTPKSGGSDTRLGSWGRWTGPEENMYEMMLFDRGTSCWNGPQRSSQVKISCGSENVVTSVSEPNRCEYLFEFSTPAACKDTGDSQDDLHDEL